MNVEYLTQPEARVGDHVHANVAKYGIPTEFVLISAFTSLTTLLRVKPISQAVHDNGGEVRMVLGVDLGGTSREVLEEVAGWPVAVSIVKNKMFGVTFHPKIYLLRWPDRAHIIVGSNNLTEGGWYRNYEASALTQYLLPEDQVSFETAQVQLIRFLKPTGPVVASLTPSYLASLLALPEIPSEADARKRRAESIPKRPPSSVFGYESIPPAPKGAAKNKPKPIATAPANNSAAFSVNIPKVVTAKKTDSFAIQVRAHYNGEIFLSVTAALQNPAFFNWPFNGLTTSKKTGNPAYPQIVPDPVVDIVVFGAAPDPILILQGYALNTVYYSKKSEIRVTASPLVGIMTDNSVMIMRRSDTPGRDYDIAIHRTDSPDYQQWLDACDQTMPGGGRPGRKFGWF